MEFKEQDYTVTKSNSTKVKKMCSFYQDHAIHANIICVAHSPACKL